MCWRFYRFFFYKVVKPLYLKIYFLFLIFDVSLWEEVELVVSLKKIARSSKMEFGHKRYHVFGEVTFSFFQALDYTTKILPDCPAENAHKHVRRVSVLRRSVSVTNCLEEVAGVRNCCFYRENLVFSFVPFLPCMLLHYTCRI